MNFFLEPGDKVKVNYCDKKKFSIGDMLLLIKWKDKVPEKYIVHRLLFKASFRGKDYLLTKGDSVFSFDYPLEKYQAVGKVVEVFKFGKWESVSNLKTQRFWFFWIFYSLIFSKLLSFNMIKARYISFFLYVALVKYNPFKIGIVKIINKAIKLFDLSFRPFIFKYASSFLFILDKDLFKKSVSLNSPQEDNVKSGKITSDELWRGEIVISDYLMIEKNVKISVLPGTNIKFKKSAPWFFPIFRCGLNEFEELDSFQAKILLYGSLNIAGKKENPVKIGGENFGGIHCFENSCLNLEYAHITDSSYSAISVWDNAFANIKNAVFENNFSAVTANNFSRTEVSSSVFKNSKTALRGGDFSLLNIKDSSISHSSDMGLQLGGQSSAEITDSLFENNKIAVFLNYKAQLFFSANQIFTSPDYAFSINDKARVFADDSEIKNNNTAIKLNGANTLWLNNCGISNNHGPAIIANGVNNFNLKKISCFANASGFEVTGRNTINIEESNFLDNKGPAFKVDGANYITSAKINVSRNALGFAFIGKNNINLNEIEISDNNGPGFKIDGENKFILNRLNILRNDLGFEALGNNNINIKESEFSKNSLGFRAAGKNNINIQKAEFLDNEGPAFKIKGANNLILNKQSVFRNGLGFEAEGLNNINIQDAEFSENKGPAFKLKLQNNFVSKKLIVLKNVSGFEVKGANNLNIEESDFTDNNGAAFKIEGANKIIVKKIAVSNNGLGFESIGRNNIVVKTGEFLKNRGAAFLLSKKSKFSGEALNVKENFSGLTASHNSRINISGSLFKDNTGYAVFLNKNTSFKADKLSFQNNSFGIRASGYSSVFIKNSSFTQKNSPSFKIDKKSYCKISKVVSLTDTCGLDASLGASVEVFNSKFQSARGPLINILKDGSFFSENSSYICGGDAIFIDEADKCAFRKSSIKSKDADGLNISCKNFFGEDLILTAGEGAIFIKKAIKVKLKKININALKYSLISHAENLIVSNLKAIGGAKGGLEIREGNNFFSDIKIENTPEPGISVSKDIKIRYGKVFVNGKKWKLSRKNDLLSFYLRKKLANFTANTAQLPGFGLFYKAVYKAALIISAEVFYFDRIKSIYLHRGIASGSWVPGLSDIDLHIVISELNFNEEFEVIKKFSSRYRMLKRFFPFLGEVLISRQDELSKYISYGGVKAQEFKAYARIIKGYPFSFSLENKTLEDISNTNESFYSYTILMKMIFSKTLYPPKAILRNTQKALLDIMRYSDTMAEADSRLSRQNYLKFILNYEKDFFGSCKFTDTSALAYKAFLHLHNYLSKDVFKTAKQSKNKKLIYKTSKPVKFDESLCKKSYLDDIVGEIRNKVGNQDLSFVLDNLYRFYIVIPNKDVKKSKLFEGIYVEVEKLKKHYTFIDANPMILSETSFILLMQSAYLNNPAFFMDFDPFNSSEIIIDEGFLGEKLIYKNIAHLKKIPVFEEFILKNAQLSLFHLANSWRFFFSDSHIHYLHSRIMCLRLILEKNIVVSPSNFKFLSEVFFQEFPETRLAETKINKPDYLFISQQIRAAINAREN
jgi:predicted nucleotidyltransferase